MYYLNIELGGLYPVAIRLGDVTQKQADDVKFWVNVAAGENEPLLTARITESFPHWSCSDNIRNYKKNTLTTISRNADVINNHTYVLCCDYIENVGKFLEAFEQLNLKAIAVLNETCVIPCESGWYVSAAMEIAEVTIALWDHWKTVRYKPVQKPLIPLSVLRKKYDEQAPHVLAVLRNTRDAYRAAIHSLPTTDFRTYGVEYYKKGNKQND